MRIKEAELERIEEVKNRELDAMIHASLAVITKEKRSEAGRKGWQTRSENGKITDPMSKSHVQGMVKAISPALKRLQEEDRLGVPSQVGGTLKLRPDSELDRSGTPNSRLRHLGFGKWVSSAKGNGRAGASRSSRTAGSDHGGSQGDVSRQAPGMRADPRPSGQNWPYVNDELAKARSSVREQTDDTNQHREISKRRGTNIPESEPKAFKRSRSTIDDTGRIVLVRDNYDSPPPALLDLKPSINPEDVGEIRDRVEPGLRRRNDSGRPLIEAFVRTTSNIPRRSENSHRRQPSLTRNPITTGSLYHTGTDSSHRDQKPFDRRSRTHNHLGVREGADESNRDSNISTRPTGHSVMRRTDQPADYGIRVASPRRDQIQQRDRDRGSYVPDVIPNRGLQRDRPNVESQKLTSNRDRDREAYKQLERERERRARRDRENAVERQRDQQRRERKRREDQERREAETRERERLDEEEEIALGPMDEQLRAFWRRERERELKKERIEERDERRRVRRLEKGDDDERGWGMAPPPSVSVKPHEGSSRRPETSVVGRGSKLSAVKPNPAKARIIDMTGLSD